MEYGPLTMSWWSFWMLTWYRKKRPSALKDATRMNAAITIRTNPAVEYLFRKKVSASSWKFDNNNCVPGKGRPLADRIVAISMREIRTWVYWCLCQAKNCVATSYRMDALTSVPFTLQKVWLITSAVAVFRSSSFGASGLGGFITLCQQYVYTAMKGILDNAETAIGPRCLGGAISRIRLSI